MPILKKNKRTVSDPVEIQVSLTYFMMRLFWNYYSAMKKQNLRLEKCFAFDFCVILNAEEVT
jgi:hypothetical protein